MQTQMQYEQKLNCLQSQSKSFEKQIESMSQRIAQYEKEKMQRLESSQRTKMDDISFRRFEDNTDDFEVIN